MKPICVPCKLFYRMKKSGFYFEEGMPGPGAAKRPEIRTFPEGMHCGLCGEGNPCHGHPFLELMAPVVRDVAGGVTRVEPGNRPDWQSYKLWSGDLWECRGCGHQIIAGTGGAPVAEHYEEGYAERRERLQVTLRVDDC